MAVKPAPIQLPAPFGADVALPTPETWNEALRRLAILEGASSGFGMLQLGGPGGAIWRATQGTRLIVVQFTAQTSIQSFYLGYTYSGTPTGPFPQGLTQGSQVYIQNLNEFFLPGKWPSIGDPAMGFPNGSFTDPATQVTLTLITVDHPATGACT
jgi:hypothetical protein